MGSGVGRGVGAGDGAGEGLGVVGDGVGTSTGAAVGTGTGAAVGAPEEEVGTGEGLGVGFREGRGVMHSSGKLTPQHTSPQFQGWPGTAQPDEVPKFEAETELETHQPRSWSKAEAPLNMSFILLTADVSQAPMSWLKAHGVLWTQ